MNYQATIDDLTKRIDKLTAARAALREISGASAPVKKKSTLSAAGLKSIKAAQRKRWAEQKRKKRAEAKKV